jgi:hypothetical protein
MSHTPYDAVRLRAELAELGAALRAVEVPAADEAALRAQFREAARRRALARSAMRGARWWPVAAAAAVVVALGAAVGAVVLRVERPAREPAVAARREAVVPAAAGAFQPLSGSPRLAPSSSYSVVRVRIPLSAFALVPGTIGDGSIEADLLVGEDGIARGIRFQEADASLASFAGQPGL